MTWPNGSIVGLFAADSCSGVNGYGRPQSWSHIVLPVRHHTGSCFLTIYLSRCDCLAHGDCSEHLFFVHVLRQILAAPLISCTRFARF